MLTVKELSVVYPDRTQALSKLTFTLPERENIALIGANGAGKTSLILSLVGVLASQGDIRVDGMLLERRTLKMVRSRIGVVFQNPDDQLFMPTIYEDIAFGLKNQGIAPAEIERRIEACLNLLQIVHLKGKTALKLSGGEKRMAALATVLVMNPSVMLFDEPTAFLDPKARRRLIQVLKSLPQSKLIATHDLKFAEQVCERSLLLKEGRIFADGRTKELLYDQVLMENCGLEAIGME